MTSRRLAALALLATVAVACPRGSSEGTPAAGDAAAAASPAASPASATSTSTSTSASASGLGRTVEEGGWPHYGGDAGGRRWSPLAQIAPGNVDRLEVAWVHHSGDVARGEGFRSTSAYELTPILVEDTLYLCTPFNRVLALDPATGEERWAFDPGIDPTANYSNQLVCRGVAAWRDPRAAPGARCALRILTATAAARLHALDARTGEPCPGFGEGGAVDLTRRVGSIQWLGEYHVTSPPVVIGDVVAVGSAIGDNQRRDAPAGVVRGYDARTGALRWAFDPAPGALARPGDAAASPGRPYTPGTPNVWAPMSADPARDLLFLPTGNAAPDYWSAVRGDLDTYASSVVAVRGSTGEIVWHFQTVHHDVWDFDVPAQPTLTTLRRDRDGDGVPEEVPVVVQSTKMGLVFVLDRETGEPFHPVGERPVPQGGAPGERLSPTQPFPVRPPPLVRHTLSPEDAWGLTPWDRGRCREELEALRYDGIYTPPTTRGSLMYPGNAGGTNWGGVAVDPERRVMLANTSDFPWKVQLFPAEEYAARRAASPHAEISPMRGAPYGMRRDPLLSPFQIPCSPPPWGTLAAVDLEAGTIRWQVPHGTVRDIAPLPLPIRWGTPNLGGPLVTGSGLVFLGAAMDDYLRAYDLETGEVLWKGRLPAGGQATPMTYRHGGRQYVVIAAGGHGRAHTTPGDALVAFSLPEAASP